MCGTMSTFGRTFTRGFGTHVAHTTLVILRERSESQDLTRRTQLMWRGSSDYAQDDETSHTHPPKQATRIDDETDQAAGLPVTRAASQDVVEKIPETTLCWVFEDAGVTIFHHHALIHEDDLVAHFTSKADLMGHHDHGHALVRQRTHH